MIFIVCHFFWYTNRRRVTLYLIFMKINADVIVEEVEDGFVIINPFTGQIRVLNKTGSFIWTLLADGETVADIPQHLVNNYGLTIEQATADVEIFVLDLRNRNLLAE